MQLIFDTNVLLGRMTLEILEAWIPFDVVKDVCMYAHTFSYCDALVSLKRSRSSMLCYVCMDMPGRAICSKNI